MTRPRIRSLKPELWADEDIGGLSRDARLLFVGLITMGDDEGRLRATPTLILGHCFPYDVDARRKLGRWLNEIEETDSIFRYEADGKPFIAIRHWRRHQRVNRPTPSDLPPPPDRRIVFDNSVNGHGGLTDRVDLPPRARGSDRIGSTTEGSSVLPLRSHRGNDRGLRDQQRGAA